MTKSDHSDNKIDGFYHPVSKPNTKPKPAQSRTLERAFRSAIGDSSLSVKLRLQALARLANPSTRFLAGLVRKPDIPAQLRFAASCRLEAVQNAQADLYEAERRAEAVLTDIRSRKTPVESVFGGLDEK